MQDFTHLMPSSGMTSCDLSRFMQMPAHIKSIEQWCNFWNTHAVEPRDLLAKHPAMVAERLIAEARNRFLANKVRQGLVYGNAATLEYIARTY